MFAGQMFALHIYIKQKGIKSIEASAEKRKLNDTEKRNHNTPMRDHILDIDSPSGGGGLMGMGGMGI